MTPDGVTAIGARIAAIQARFAPPSGFASTLAEVTSQPDGTSASEPATGAPGVGSVSASSVSAGSAQASAGPGWAGKLPPEGRPWALAIEQAARSAGVEPQLLAAVVQAESGLRPDVVSHAGAVGLAQLMPGTAAGLGVDPADPAANLAGGARYLREQLDRFGAVDLALAAYNAGPQRVAEAGGIPQISETQSYVERVRSNYEKLR